MRAYTVRCGASRDVYNSDVLERGVEISHHVAGQTIVISFQAA